MKVLRLSGSLAIVAAVAALAACGGGGGSTGGGGTQPNPPAPVVTSSPTPPPPPTTQPPTGPTSITASGNPVSAHDGSANGAAYFNPNSGDFPAGGQGSPVDSSITCTQSTESTSTSIYHMHAFLGIIVNGTYEQLPIGIGMVPPGAASGGSIVNPGPGGCMYQIHTHDASGTIHLENPAAPQGSNSMYTLQNFFDVWGNGPGASTFPSGTVSYYVGTPSGKVNGNDEVTSYTLASGNAASIQLTRHMAVWAIVGSVPSTLPPVIFTFEY